MLAIGAFSIGEHEMATGTIAIAAIGGIWAAFKWFKGQIKEQVDVLGEATRKDLSQLTKDTKTEIETVAARTAEALLHHNEMITARLNLQDSMARSNQDLLLEKIAHLDSKLTERAKH